MENYFQKCICCKQVKNIDDFYRSRYLCKYCYIKDNYKNEKIECECKKIILKINIEKHRQTSIHKKRLKFLNKVD